MGFVVTFFKVQGKTIIKIIIDLNKRAFQPGENELSFENYDLFLSFIIAITFEALLVGLSRVSSGDNFRVLPLQPGQTWTHLTQLKPNEELRSWLSGFDSQGDWDRSRVIPIERPNKRKNASGYKI